MHRSTIGFFVLIGAFFFGFSRPAMAGQSSAPAKSVAGAGQDSAPAAQDCARTVGTRLDPPINQGAEANPESAQATAISEMAGDPATPAAPVAVDFVGDLKLLQQRQSELAQCLPSNDPSAGQPALPPLCVNELLLNFEMRHDGEIERDVPIGRLPGTSAFFYESGMTIDADGAPNAYHPDNLGLDDLANAGSPGNWPGLAKDADGEPYVQGPDDPFPGYYVSETALADRSKPANDPTRYVDASKIPFLVLPGGMARALGARPGDFAVVFNLRNGKSSYAIYGDVGPSDRIGEGSIALAENLRIRSDARNGGARRGILYLLFPGTGNGRPRTLDEISAEGQRLLLDWENAARPVACAEQRTASDEEGGRGAN